MELGELKKQFAANLYSEPGNPFKAALGVFPDDTGLACMYAREWNQDPEVLAEIERLKDIGNVSEQVPDKLLTMIEAWKIATNDYVKPKDRVDALRLFAEIAGHMPDKTVNKNVKSETNVNKVMVIKDHGNDEEWERKLANQQKALLDA